MEWLAEPVLRFAQYVVLLGLFGWSAFGRIGLPALGWQEDYRRPALAMLAATAAPIVSAALMLLSIATMMGLPVSALDWPMTEAMLLGTDMGYAFMVRTGLLLAGLVALLAVGHNSAGPMLTASCFAGALMTLGWNGHAAATEGGLGLFHRLNDGIHLIVAGLWLGAIGWLWTLTVQCHRDSDAMRAQVLLKVLHRFAPLGITLVALVALTGIINSHLIFGLINFAAILVTPYGVLLTCKILLVAAMLLFGAYNARTSKSLGSTAGLAEANPRPVLAALRRSLASELLLGLTVTGFVAVLGTMSPFVT